MTPGDIAQFVGIALAAVALVLVIRWRHRDHAKWTRHHIDERLCAHLRPALDRLLEQGHRIEQIGQRAPDLPFEVHVAPTFDPVELARACDLHEADFVSDRGVLYCQEHFCELHPEQSR